MKIMIYRFTDRNDIVGIVDEALPFEERRLKVRFAKCAVIRWWGTKRGIGQLCFEGPQPETKLDELPHGSEFSLDYCWAIHSCLEERWTKWTQN